MCSKCRCGPISPSSRRYRGDRLGNLSYRMAMRSFNMVMATAAKVVIAEVDELVPVGAFSPEDIHTPGIFVDHVVQVERHPKLFEPQNEGRERMTLTRDGIAYRVACDLPDGSYVNLGIGIPSLVAAYLSPDKEISFTARTASWAWGRWRRLAPRTPTSSTRARNT